MNTLFFSAPAAQSAMCPVLVFPLLGPLLAAIQFTEQAEEYQKVQSFFWASEQSYADGCRVQRTPELTLRSSGPGQLGAGTKEEEEGEEKGEEAVFGQ